MKTGYEVHAECLETWDEASEITIIDEALLEARNEGRAELIGITHRNYLATVRRGLITPTTCVLEFCDKIDEEKKELIDSYMCDTFDPSELADIALVCFAMAEHYGIDLVDEMRKKTEFNEKRP